MTQIELKLKRLPEAIIVTEQYAVRCESTVFQFCMTKHKCMFVIAYMDKADNCILIVENENLEVCIDRMFHELKRLF